MASVLLAYTLDVLREKNMKINGNYIAGDMSSQIDVKRFLKSLYSDIETDLANDMATWNLLDSYL